jgi:hypothetical protein
MIPAAQTHLALQRIDDAHGLPAGIVRRQVGIALRHFRIAVAKQN